MVHMALFEAIGELQRKRLHQSHAAAFSWNGRMHGQFLQAKSWVPSSLFRHCSHREWSMAGIFHTGEVSTPCRGQCNGADFTEISKFPEILGQLSMRKQCVPGFFSLPTHESLVLRLTYVILVFISGEDLVTSPAAWQNSKSALCCLFRLTPQCSTFSSYEIYTCSWAIYMGWLWRAIVTQFGGTSSSYIPSGVESTSETSMTSGELDVARGRRMVLVRVR